MSLPLSPMGTLIEKPVKQDVWEEALTLLSQEDRERFDLTVLKNQAHQDLLQDVLVATNEKKAECLRKRWKVVRGDRTIILRDMLEKVAVWVRTFVAVGDTLMQYDPGHAALPWAAIRFFLQATVNDVQIYGNVLQSIELISNLLARCVIMERLYLQSVLDITDRFRKALVELYAAMLTTLAKGLRYYGYTTALRIAKSIVTNLKDVESSSSAVSEKLAEVERLATVAEAEKMEQIAQNVEILRTERQQLDQRLERRDEKLSQLLKQLQNPISRMDMQLSDLHDNLQMEMRIKILKAISTIPYPVHHKTVVRDRLEGSGKWLLEESAYKDWRAESSSSVLWLHGIPGSGKTKLASLVIDDIRSSAHLAYFYCMRNPAEPERAECDKILSCLVRQLASISPKSPILEPVRLKYELAVEGFEGFEDQALATDESTQVLIDLTNIYPSVTFVLDALDEVNPVDRLQLLNALNEIVQCSGSLIKVFISSRDNIDIAMHLKDSPNLYISAADNREDINAFVNQRLGAVKLLHGKLPTTVHDKVAKTLIDGAHGMFRWVDLQIQSLRALKVAADIEARLGRLPETLEGSYWEVFQQIQESGEHAAKLARFTFQWLLSAQSFMSLEDFAVLASVGSGDLGTEYTASDILDVCANLVINDGATSFRFAHLSVREFLESLSKRQVDDFRPAETNAALGSACISYLVDLFSDPENVPSGNNLEYFASTEDTKHRLLKRYTIKHWPDHVSSSGPYKHAPPLESQVQSFLVRDKDVSPEFKAWCKVVMEIPLVPESIEESARLHPSNPIWIALKYDLIGLDKISLTTDAMARGAFVYAAEKGNVKVISTLLEYGVSIKEAGNEAISAAAKTGWSDIVSLLLEKGAPTGPKNLYWAILCQHADVADLLLGKGSHKFTATELSKALTTAVSNGDSASVAMLLNHGAQKESVAVLRTIKNGTLRAAHNLIDHGFDIRGQFLVEKRTPLHWAAEKGYLEVTSKLLINGVSSNPKDRYENTPLHLAAEKGHSRVIALLLDHDADIAAKNIAGRTALHLVSMMNHPKAALILLGHGSNVHTKDLEGWTPLQLAQIYQHDNIVNLMSPSRSSPRQQTQNEPSAYPNEVSDIPSHQTTIPLFTEITILPEVERDPMIPAATVE